MQVPSLGSPTDWRSLFLQIHVIKDMAQINKCIRRVSYDALRSTANKINEESAFGVVVLDGRRDDKST